MVRLARLSRAHFVWRRRSAFISLIVVAIPLIVLVKIELTVRASTTSRSISKLTNKQTKKSTAKKKTDSYIGLWVSPYSVPVPFSNHHRFSQTIYMKRYIDNTKNCLLQCHSSSFILLSITYAQTAQTLCKYRRAVCRIVRFFSSNSWNIKTNNDDDEKKEYGRHKVWLCMSNALRSREFKVMNWTALTQPELQNQKRECNLRWNVDEKENNNVYDKMMSTNNKMFYEHDRDRELGIGVWREK